ncbi:MAG: helix-turn-helix domain-containing protein [Conexivisphaerales archaeon]
MERAYKFRIYPNLTKQERIDELLILAQQFYNKLLEKSIESYKSKKTKISMAQLNRFAKEIIQEDGKYLKLYSQTRCEIKFRASKGVPELLQENKGGEGVLPKVQIKGQIQVNNISSGQRLLLNNKEGQGSQG